MASAASESDLRKYLRALYPAWGEPLRRPAESQFEVVVGAYLRQNTAWTNVERAYATSEALIYQQLKASATSARLASNV